MVIATDGELYGHHQPFRDLFLHRLVAPDESTRDRGYDVVTLAEAVAEPPGEPHPEVRIRDRTSWSCHHGVLRWSGECPDASDGRWKAPLRAALERLAGGIDAVTEGLARELPGRPDPWAARDRYVDVVIGAEEDVAFAGRAWAGGGTAGDARRLLTVLEAQRWRLAMFASCGWFWEDPARTETRQVLRAAARARHGSWTGSRRPTSRLGSWPTSRRSRHRRRASTGRRSTGVRSPRWAWRRPGVAPGNPTTPGRTGGRLGSGVWRRRATPGERAKIRRCRASRGGPGRPTGRGSRRRPRWPRRPGSAMRTIMMAKMRSSMVALNLSGFRARVAVGTVN